MNKLIAKVIMRRKPIRRVSKARAKQHREYEQVKFDFLEDNEVCFVCKKWVPVLCRELHHYFGRTGRLLAWTPGFRVTCHKCHDFIHKNIALSANSGFVCPKGMWNDYDKALEYENSRTNR